MAGAILGVSYDPVMKAGRTAPGILTDFLEPGELVDADLRLAVADRVPGVPAKGLVPAYEFSMIAAETTRPVGRISLRLGADDFLVNFAGQIGYGVEEPFRGRRYAARSCALLFPLARAHGFEELWITCNPDNVASRRTCEIAGGELIEIVELPVDCDMYRRGERLKCRYRVDLARAVHA